MSRIESLRALAAVALLSSGYGHGRRLDTPYDDETAPAEPVYVAADWGAKPATSVTEADLQRISAAQDKRARKAAKRLSRAKEQQG
jgi:hypothetical protein